jgi:hypothetical protein
MLHSTYLPPDAASHLSELANMGIELPTQFALKSAPNEPIGTGFDYAEGKIILLSEDGQQFSRSLDDLVIFRADGEKPRMSKEEAERFIEKINSASQDLESLITEFSEREGYLALGYSSFKQCCLSLLPNLSKSSYYRWRDASQIRKTIGSDASNAPEAALRPLAKVAKRRGEKEVRSVWKEAKAMASGKTPTAKQVKAAADKLGDGRGASDRKKSADLRGMRKGLIVNSSHMTGVFKISEVLPEYDPPSAWIQSLDPEVQPAIVPLTYLSLAPTARGEVINFQVKLDERKSQETQIRLQSGERIKVLVGEFLESPSGKYGDLKTAINEYFKAYGGGSDEQFAPVQ